MSPTAIKVLIIALFLSLVSSLFVNYNYYTNEADQIAAVEKLRALKNEEDVRKKLWKKKAETRNPDPDINNGRNYNNTQF